MLNRRRLLGAVLSSVATVPFWGMGAPGVDRDRLIHGTWGGTRILYHDDTHTIWEEEYIPPRWGTAPYNSPT